LRLDEKKKKRQTQKETFLEEWKRNTSEPKKKLHLFKMAKHVKRER